MSHRATLRRGLAAIISVAAGAAAVLAPVLLTSGAASAAPAPYPPGEPCALSAVPALGAVAAPRMPFVLTGSGLGASQRVHLTTDPAVAAASAQELGWVRADLDGRFRTTITVAVERVTTRFAATSPDASCSTEAPTPGRSPVPTAGGSGGPGASNGPGSTPSRSEPGTAIAQPGPGIGTPVGVGLGIAAALLVLGTLAVVFLTRRGGTR